MRFDRCALCKKFMTPDSVVALETSDKEGDNLSLEICKNCEGALGDVSEKNYLEILLEEDLKDE